MRVEAATAAAVAAVALLTAAVLFIADVSFAAGLIAIGVLVVGVWVLIPSQGNTPKWLSLALLFLVISTALPSALSGLVQLLALGIGFFAWLASSPQERRGRGPVVWAALIVGYWFILMFHPNIPSIELGAFGFRKTVLCVAGIAAGAAIPRQLVPSVERSAIRVIVLAVSTSIILHLFFPALELSIGRAAGQYTALFGNEARLQGIFAGPFHVALACIVLVAWSLVRMQTDRRLATAAIIVGAVGGYMSLVRSAYVAMLIVVLAIAFFAPTLGKALKRLSLTAIIGIIALAIGLSASPDLAQFLSTILNLSEDSRFLGRFPGYAHGLQLFAQSPLFGWGAGSAGDTLTIPGGVHVTSHNVVLKVMVEGGLIGLTLWLGLFISIARHISTRTSEAVLAIAVLCALLMMGLTVASIEALPVSYFIFFLAGLALAKGKPGDRPEDRHPTLRPRQVRRSGPSNAANRPRLGSRF